MTLVALGLVLASALLHATWNLFAKRAGGGISFVWLFSTAATVIYSPVLLFVLIRQPTQISPLQLVYMCGTSALHVGYYYLLNRGYQVGDLSLVYPLARGTGPVLATLAAIALLGERPTLVAVGGTLLIAVGVFILTGDPLWFSSLGRTIVLAPIAIRRWDEVRASWMAFRREVVGIAVFDTLSYLLFLTALVFSPVSYIAPARQISILLGALMGSRWLAEGHSTRRLAAVGAMTVGLVILVLA